MRYAYSLCLLVISSFPLSAQTQPGNKNGADHSQVLSDSVITIQHSGRPSYRIDIANDGTLVYDGFASVKTNGKLTTKITPKQLDQLLKEFEKAKFLSLRDSYNFESGCTAGGFEGPWIELTLRVGRKVKTINHDLECICGDKEFVRELKVLRRLGSRIHEILNIDQWIGTMEERSKLPNPLAIPKKN